MTFLRQALVVAHKDLTIEMRGHHAVGAAAPFAATMLLSFGLALGPGRSLLQATAPGLLWLAVMFSSVLAFRQAYRIETDDDAVEGLVLSGIDLGAVFLGKATAVAVELLGLEFIAVVMVAWLFDLALVERPLLLAASLVLGTIGLSAIGSLFGMLAESPRAAEGILPLLVLPIAVPVLLAGVRLTSLAESGGSTGAGSWLGLLVAFDVSVVAIGTLLFGELVEER